MERPTSPREPAGHEPPPCSCSRCQGCAYLYQGEELGLPRWPTSLIGPPQDPCGSAPGKIRGRDGCRVPLPWTGTDPPSASPPGTTPWLPQPPNWGALSVEAQDREPDSTLELYRHALQSEVRPAPRHESLTWLPRAAGVLAFKRGERFHCSSTSARADRLAGQTLLPAGPIRACFRTPRRGRE